MYIVYHLWYRFGQKDNLSYWVSTQPVHRIKWHYDTIKDFIEISQRKIQSKSTSSEMIVYFTLNIVEILDMLFYIGPFLKFYILHKCISFKTIESKTI